MPALNLTDVSMIATGAARGIGAAVVRHLVEGGARVVIADIAEQDGEELASELGENAIFHRLDVTDADAWDTVVQAAKSHFGRVNALFNNAGIIDYGPLVDVPPERFRRVIDVNLVGTFLGIRAVAPAIAHAGGGVIINTSSITGLQGYADLGAYSASKWGIRGLTKGAALELGTKNIRVLSLHPGAIRTPMTSEISENLARQQPIPRIGDGLEVARMVRFMLTEATFSTGSEFVIDGGAVSGKGAIREANPS
jgi:3alpha(or 20beta)-hydroxysteroid dehydrogenase